MGRKFETEFPLTKILATLGPASEDAGTIGRLIESGVRVFRINFSHGTFDDYERMLDRVRQVSRDRGVYVGVLGDLCGPKLRVGKVVEGGVQLTPGSRVEFRRDVEETTAPVDGAPVKLSTNYPMLVEEVEPGQNILLDDGKVRLVCREKTGRGAARSLVCKVIHGGTITSRKGVNLPDTKLSTPALTEKDEECVKFAVK
ncbi:MAG: pyruvate kinase, partial [Planctomycetes bacterium]|nr:pyruvate kinase [Planctomycetota bacterium]